MENEQLDRSVGFLKKALYREATDTAYVRRLSHQAALQPYRVVTLS